MFINFVTLTFDRWHWNIVSTHMHTQTIGTISVTSTALTEGKDFMLHLFIFLFSLQCVKNLRMKSRNQATPALSSRSTFTSSPSRSRVRCGSTTTCFCNSPTIHQSITYAVRSSLFKTQMRTSRANCLNLEGWVISVYFWYTRRVTREQTLRSFSSNSEKSVSYQKKDGRSHAHPSLFWYDNDKDI